MGILDIRIKVNQNLQTKCKYLFLDERCIEEYYRDNKCYKEVYRLYLYDVDCGQELFIDKEELFEVFISINTNYGIKRNLNYLKIKPIHKIIIGNQKIQEIRCQIDFSVDYDEFFVDYEQPLIDIYHYWDEGRVLPMHYKNQYIYNTATRYYSGRPKKMENNQHIIIDGNEIFGVHHLYTVLAELLIGDKTYLANRLDFLIDNLQDSINKETNTNSIEINNSKRLVKILSIEFDNYFNKLIEIFEECGFKIILK